jgi:alpha-glucosidase
VTERLDHLAWLGVGAIWLSPTMPSPNLDWGYDVSDYYGVHPDLGTLDDLDRLVAEARRQGIDVLLDLVPNHTSDRHPWFQEARASRTSPRRDWYVWADPGPGGAPPNNWLDPTGRPAWTLDEATGQCYLHNFLPEQPDLNWWNPEVRDEFDRILAFWFQRGVAGFRIDVADGIVKDRELRDNPPAGADATPMERRLGLANRFSRHRPEVHDVHRHWRRLADSWDPPRLLVGETVTADPEQWAGYYGVGDELHLALNFAFMFAPFAARPLARAIDRSLALLPTGGRAAWAASNHDVSRFPTRWAGGREPWARLALVLLLTLRGVPVLYQGDEIGAQDVPVPDERIQDGFGKPGSVRYPGRDAARTPMQWEPGPGAGFSPVGVEPWLPIGDADRRSVAAQRADRDSTLHLCRDLVRLRSELPDLRDGEQVTVHLDDASWAYRRGAGLTVALNFGEEVHTVPGVAGDVVLGTDRSREGSRTAGSLQLAPGEGAIVRNIG